MNVKELIEELKKYPENSNVIIVLSWEWDGVCDDISVKKSDVFVNNVEVTSRIK